MLESPSFLASILAGPHGADCVIAPDDSPTGGTIRVIFDLDYFAVDQETGQYQSTDPRVMARTQDVSAVVVEETVLLIQSQRYVAQRLEPVVGNDVWRAVILRRTS